MAAVLTTIDVPVPQRVRQTWNKFNLFNLHNIFVPPNLIAKTFFQQKWIAKSLVRGYHGEHIKERQWERMFSRHLDSVVEMNPRYMAAFDGSEQAAGRGRGLKTNPDVYIPENKRFQPENGTNQKSSQKTPYMSMTFAPMERRLDIAIFRAMFASSARQARQFVVHGAVTVNGKKMIYPGYLLNPGDLFQVDVERVLYAVGAKKPTRRAEERKRLAQAAEQAAEQAEEAEATEQGEGEAETEAAAASDSGSSEGAVAVATAANKRAVRELPYLAERAKNMLADRSTELSVKRKKALRKFVKDARKIVAKATSSLNAPDGTPAKTMAAPDTSDVVDRLADLLAGLPPPSQAAADASADAGTDADKQVASKAKKAQPSLTPEERERFQALIKQEAENPYDPSKPYATPWRPRPFLNGFAFIPRYLEVNQNICAAVYLRHPVARPGEAEVPTPFPEEIYQLAFNWYLRRR